MKQEWFQTKELVGVAGLPATPQGLSKKARAEEWVKRKVEGEKRAFEYHIDSLPALAQRELTGENATKQPQASPEHDEWCSEWMVLLAVLSDAERETLLNTVKRNGVNLLMSLTLEDNVELLALSDEIKHMALAIKHLPSERVREIYNNLAEDKRAAPLIEKSVNRAG